MLEFIKYLKWSQWFSVPHSQSLHLSLVRLGWGLWTNMDRTRQCKPHLCCKQACSRQVSLRIESYIGWDMLSLCSCTVSPCHQYAGRFYGPNINNVQFLAAFLTSKNWLTIRISSLPVKTSWNVKRPRPCRLGLWTLHSQTHPAMLIHFQLHRIDAFGLVADLTLGLSDFLDDFLHRQGENIPKTSKNLVETWDLTLDAPLAPWWNGGFATEKVGCLGRSKKCKTLPSSLAMMRSLMHRSVWYCACLLPPLHYNIANCFKSLVCTGPSSDVFLNWSLSKLPLAIFRCLKELVFQVVFRSSLNSKPFIQSLACLSCLHD